MPLPALLLAAASIIGTGFQVAGHITAGRDAKDQAELEARAAQAQAREDRRAAEDQASDLRRRVRIMREESEDEISRLNRATLSESERVKRAAIASNVGLTRQVNQLIGSQRVAIAKGGVTLSGTAEQVVGETGREADRLREGIEVERSRIITDLNRTRSLEEIAIRHATDIDAETLETTAKRAVRRGRIQQEAGIQLSRRLRVAGERAEQAGRIGGAGALLTGVATAGRILD